MFNMSALRFRLLDTLPHGNTGQQATGNTTRHHKNTRRVRSRVGLEPPHFAAHGRSVARTCGCTRAPRHTIPQKMHPLHASREARERDTGSRFRRRHLVTRQRHREPSQHLCAACAVVGHEKTTRVFSCVVCVSPRYSTGVGRNV